MAVDELVGNGVAQPMVEDDDDNAVVSVQGAGLCLHTARPLFAAAFVSWKVPGISMCLLVPPRRRKRKRRLFVRGWSLPATNPGVAEALAVSLYAVTLRPFPAWKAPPWAGLRAKPGWATEVRSFYLFSLLVSYTSPFVIDTVRQDTQWTRCRDYLIDSFSFLLEVLRTLGAAENDPLLIRCQVLSCCPGSRPRAIPGRLIVFRFTCSLLSYWHDRQQLARLNSGHSGTSGRPPVIKRPCYSAFLYLPLI
jgi:hypothetical protein